MATAALPRTWPQRAPNAPAGLVVPAEGETATELASGIHRTSNVMLCMWTSNWQDPESLQERDPMVSVRRECKKPVQ